MLVGCEAGFQLNWAGANEQRGNKEQESKDRRKSGGFSFFRSSGAQSTAGAATDALASGDTAAPRRQWDAPVQFIRGMNGPIRASYLAEPQSQQCSSDWIVKIDGKRLLLVCCV